MKGCRDSFGVGIGGFRVDVLLMTLGGTLYKEFLGARANPTYTCVYIYIYLYTHTHMYIYIYIYGINKDCIWVGLYMGYITLWD